MKMMVFEADSSGFLTALVEAPLLDGVYTTFRTYRGARVLRLEQHLVRLRESARLRGLGGELGQDRFERTVARAVAAAPVPEVRLRVSFAPPRLVVAVDAFEPLPPQLYETGVACACVAARRALPHAKDTRFLRQASAAYADLPEGAHEGLMVEPADGTLLEGLSSNFFAVLGGELRTEDGRVLPGVTRAIVMELAAGLVPVRLVGVRRDDLPQLEEAFLTSVSRGVLPVVRLDGRAVGEGRPGPVALELRARLAALVEREARPLQSM